MPVPGIAENLRNIKALSPLNSEPFAIVWRTVVGLTKEAIHWFWSENTNKKRQILCKSIVLDIELITPKQLRIEKPIILVRTR